MKSINQYIQEKLVLTKNIIDKNTRKNYLQFKAVENNCIISMNASTEPYIEYSFDCKEWIEWDYSDIKLNKGQTVYMRGDNQSGFNNSHNKYNKFVMTGKIEAHGNIMSLLYKDNFENKLEIPCKYCFFNLFGNCKKLLTHPELPANILADYCYGIMFNGCTSLTQAPELPATELDAGCYFGMFEGCTSLTQAPELPATTLAEKCYYGMFESCTSLTQAPELPATKLTHYCYEGMFFNCILLTQAPELPATTLAYKCYYSMFAYCESLKQKPKIAVDINNNNCEDMFKYCPCENK